MPELQGARVVLPSAEAVAQRLAEVLALRLTDRLSQADSAHLALSGGATPKRLYALLAERADLTAEHWKRIHLWIVDERRVPKDDPRLNFGMIQEALVAKIPIPPTHVHPMPVDRPDGDRVYETELRSALGPEDPRLDITILGMGPDGHTASLFPFTPALDQPQRLVVWNEGERVIAPRPRMTMTFRLLNRSRFTALLVTGESKRSALTAYQTGNHDLRALPVLGIRPVGDGDLTWFLDAAANT